MISTEAAFWLGEFSREYRQFKELPFSEGFDLALILTSHQKSTTEAKMFIYLNNPSSRAFSAIDLDIIPIDGIETYVNEVKALYEANQNDAVIRYVPPMSREKSLP